MEDLQLQLAKREEELTQAMMKVDEEAAGKAQAQKAIREVESQLTEVRTRMDRLPVTYTQSHRQRLLVRALISASSDRLHLHCSVISEHVFRPIGMLSKENISIFNRCQPALILIHALLLIFPVK